LRFRVVGGHRHQRSDPPPAAALLRARPERPGGGRAAEQRDERAPSHSITCALADAGYGCPIGNCINIEVERVEDWAVARSKSQRSAWSIAKLLREQRALVQRSLHGN
jgi:hypothetical protein